MKVRNGFVSNSSSSSFVIKLDNISAKQLRQIENHYEVAKALGLSPWPSDWDITVTDSAVEGYTSMDNFDMKEFLLAIGVKEEDIDIDRY